MSAALSILVLLLVIAPWWIVPHSHLLIIYSQKLGQLNPNTCSPEMVPIGVIGAVITLGTWRRTIHSAWRIPPPPVWFELLRRIRSSIPTPSWTMYLAISYSSSLSITPSRQLPLMKAKMPSCNCALLDGGNGMWAGATFEDLEDIGGGSRCGRGDTGVGCCCCCMVSR